jgi:hypothetical protein
MKRVTKRRGIAAIVGAACACVALGVTACGSSSQAPETPPAPSAHPAPRALPAPPPAAVNDDAGPPAPERPRAISLDSFGEGERIADLSAISVGDRILLGWVTYFDEGSAALRGKKTGRSSPKTPAAATETTKLGASVVVRALDKDAEALGPPKVVSFKGVSAGGIAFARGAALRSDALLAKGTRGEAAPAKGAPPRGEVALAWVGKDAGLGQVFLTKLSDDGDKLAQKMITHAKTSCSDVGVAAVSDGFVAAWIESSEAKTEIVATKVSRDFSRVGPERRLAESKGEASDVRVTSLGDEVLVLWSEARDQGDGGIGAARLTVADMTVHGDPALVLSAPRHPRGIDLSRFGEGVELGWVEDAPLGPADAGAPTRSLFLAHLDAMAKSPSGRAAVPVLADPSSVAVDCERVCRVVVPAGERGELALYGFSYDGTTPSPLRRIASLAGVSTEDTSPVLVKDWLFFAEDNLRGGGRIRKAKLAW